MEKFLKALASDQLQVVEVTETRNPKAEDQAVAHCPAIGGLWGASLAGMKSTA